MRKIRELKCNAEYHVTARANRKEFIFESKEMKDLFLSVLKDAKKKYKFLIKNFCIMGNHIHMIIKPLAKENLSKIMQWILSVFAVKYNKLLGITGHVWYDRFRSKIIDDIRQLIATYRYIAENPVRAGIVDNPIHYEYNGITHAKKNKFDVMEPPSGVLSDQF